MKLPNPIKLRYPNGHERIVTELLLITIDQDILRKVMVSIGGFTKPLILWEGDEYDNIGDYTQAQVENRILELLGDDPKTTIESLFNNIPK